MPTAARDDAVRAGSTYVRFADQPPLDLIVALDEASSEIYPVLLVVEEGAALRFGLDEATWDEWVVVFLLHRSEWLDIEPPFLL